MDIQGYVIDHWLGKMSAERSVLVIYDPDWLPLLYKKQKALQVFTCRALLFLDILKFPPVYTQCS